MAKYTKKLEFSKKQREKIKERDGGCIFCRLNYRMEKALPGDLTVFDIMHYIPRSSLGLGIEQNAAVGCRYHHNMMDNGNSGAREEMLEIFRNYLENRYPEWNEKDLIYSKWG